MRAAERKPVDFDGINREALRLVEALCRRWLPQGRRSGNWWSACNPTRTDRHPSLAVSLKSGSWRDFATDDHGSDLVSLLAYLEGIGQYEAALCLSVELGVGASHEPQPAARHAKPADEAGRGNGEWALQIWRESQPGPGTLLECYLRARGITIPVPPSLRFHPALKHAPSGELFPAMVAGVQGPDRRIVGIHRTFLQADGKAKAPVEPPKMMLGLCAGGCVRLGPVGDELHIAEGIESALAAMQATGVPTWASLSTSGLRSLVLPSKVRTAIILADGDRPGLAAADATARRWVAEGRRVRIAKPPSGRDMADLLLEGAA